MLGQKIKELRKQKKMSQTEFGKFIGVSQTTVTAWENGRAEPSSNFIAKIANLFNVSTDFLLGSSPKDEPNINKSVDDAINSMHHYQGRPVSDEDKAVIRGILHGYFENKS